MFQSALRILNVSVPRLSRPAEAYDYFLFKTNYDHPTVHTDKLRSAMNDVQLKPVLRYLSYIC